MTTLLKIVRSRFAFALVAALFGGVVGLVLAALVQAIFILEPIANFVKFLLQFLLIPATTLDSAYPVAINVIAVLIIVGHVVVGFGSALGLFQNTRLGRFLYYSSETALVWGLFGQAVSFAAGNAFINLFRILGGAQWDWLNEGAVVFGAIISIIGSLLGAGVLTDWLLWIGGHKTPLRHGAPEGKPEWFRYFSVDVNHKVIGIQYGVTSLLVLFVGGIFAIIFRLELSQPGMQFLNFDQYNTLFSAHGIVMIVSILLGIGAMSNYLVPLMIGASDMAFPRLNAFSYWISVPSIVLVLAGMAVGGWDTGWVAYAPLSLNPAMLGVQLFLLGFYMNGFSSIASAINIIVSTFTMRAKGMTLFRMPIFVWGALAAALIQFTATQTVGVALSMTIAERTLGLTFFNPANGGDPILYQHLFWFYSHPVVYVFVLPGLGIISELLPVFSRKPLFGYRWIALSSLGIALVGFLVWAHHMFVAGMSDTLRIVFMISTMFVAIPTGVKFFSWVATMWEGKLSFETPMLFVVGAISVFLIGGVTGPILGTIPTDMHLHDSYWVVGHFHATMFGGFIFPFCAALYYWYPKITGHMYKESLGRLHFWLMVPGFWVMSFGQMSIGILGMNRRYADYEPALGIGNTQILITITALVIGWSLLIMVYNFIASARTEPVAETNPWRSRSPEWQTPTPIPEFNYDVPFEVVGDPYDYGLASSQYINTAPAATGD
ncbi:cytochrome c oxidase subunit I [Candidatus Leptofilum sp.]|uniref:cytochrome c oxidase subunit I n=1 Tax=Candidatus Leptofilum sp. TaxID=3241576 RepID=UPI003B5B41E1